MDNNIPKGCKPFDLQKAMAGEPVVTRDGKPYKFGAYNPEAVGKDNIVGWVDGLLATHHSNGKRLFSGEQSINDLFMAAKTQKVWVNIWRNSHGKLVSMIWESEADAASDLSNPYDCILLKTIETEVEL